MTRGGCSSSSRIRVCARGHPGRARAGINGPRSITRAGCRGRSLTSVTARSVAMSDRLGEVRAAFADADLRQLSVAFAFGMAYGAALERERIDAEDLNLTRGWTRAARKIIDQANARP